MLALTVRPPWSWAIAHGGKTIENRSGSASRWQRAVGQEVLIHAGVGWSRRGETDPRVGAAWWPLYTRTRPPEWGLPPVNGRTRTDLVHLVLGNVRPVRFVPIPRGRLGLWHPGDEVERDVRDALEMV